MFQIHKKLKSTYKALALQQSIGAIFLFLDEFAGVLPIYFVGLALDEFKTGTITSTFLFNTILKIIGISLFSYTISVAWMFFIHNAGNYGGYFLRKKFFASLLTKQMNFFEKYTAGDLLARASNDIDFVDGYFGGGFLLLMDSFAYPIVYIGLMAYLTSWKLTLATIAPFPIITILYFFTADELEKRADSTYQKFSLVSQEILEMAEGIKLIRSFCNEQVRLNKLSYKVKLYFDAVYFKARLDAILNPIVNFITEISTIIAFSYGSFLVSKGEITYGNLVSFFMFVYMFTWAAMASSFYVQLYKSALASAERIVEILNAKEKENTGTKELKTIESIEFKNFNFKYGNEMQIVLENLSFKMKKKEKIAIVGKTGSGKTTLIRSLLNLYDMKEGLFINGEDYRTFSPKSFKKQIAYVSQREQVFSDSIYNNVTFFDSSYTIDEVKEVLKIAHLDENFPLGIKTQIGERGLSLSGGQRQRLSIARALITRPSLLLLDDAFSAIDSKTATKIIQSFNKTSMFESLIVVTHKPAIAKEMDRIVVIEDGKVKEEGTHAELLEKGGWYATEFSCLQEKNIEKEEV
ncbi:MAG: ABC transporter ATP-binding protein [Treponema sp.]